MQPDPGQVIRRQADTIRPHEETICRQAETIRQQEQIIRRQQARIAELEQLVARLTAQVAALFTLFKIDAPRGSDVLVEVLGREFEGVLGCDYFSAYRKYMGEFDVRVQFRLAHLTRDVKFLTTLQDRATQRYAERLLDRLRRLFQVIHRRDTMPEDRFQRALQRAHHGEFSGARRHELQAERIGLARAVDALHLHGSRGLSQCGRQRERQRGLRDISQLHRCRLEALL